MKNCTQATPRPAIISLIKKPNLCPSSSRICQTYPDSATLISLFWILKLNLRKWQSRKCREIHSEIHKILERERIRGSTHTHTYKCFMLHFSFRRVQFQKMQNEKQITVIQSCPLIYNFLLGQVWKERCIKKETADSIVDANVRLSHVGPAPGPSSVISM